MSKNEKFLSNDESDNFGKKIVFKGITMYCTKNFWGVFIFLKLSKLYLIDML